MKSKEDQKLFFKIEKEFNKLNFDEKQWFINRLLLQSKFSLHTETRKYKNDYKEKYVHPDNWRKYIMLSFLMTAQQGIIFGDDAITPQYLVKYLFNGLSREKMLELLLKFEGEFNKYLTKANTTKEGEPVRIE